MEVELEEFQRFLDGIQVLNNAGIRYVQSDSCVIVNNGPASFQICLEIEETDIGVLLKGRSLRGAAAHLSKYFASYNYCSFAELTEASFALLRGFLPTSTCPFCGAHFEGFAPLTEDEYLRTLAVIRLMNKKLEDIQNMPLLDCVCSEKQPFIVNLRHPDAFIVIKRYNGPILGNGALRVGGNANFYDSEKQELKNLNELELVDGFWREKSRGYERNFMQFAMELGENIIFDNRVVEYHDVCRVKYEKACGASEFIAVPKMQEDAAIQLLLKKEMEMLAKYGQRSQEMEREGAAEMYEDYEEFETERSQPPGAMEKSLMTTPNVQVEFESKTQPEAGGGSGTQGYQQLPTNTAESERPTLTEFKAQIYCSQSFQQALNFDTIQTFRNYVNSFGQIEQAVAEYERDCISISPEGIQIMDRIAQTYKVEYEK